MLAEYVTLSGRGERKRLTDRALRLNKDATAALLRGLFTAEGTVVDVGVKARYVGLDATSETMLQQVQTLLLGFGIKSTLYRNRRLTDRALLPDGEGSVEEVDVPQMHSLRITRRSRVRFEKEIGFYARKPQSRRARRVERGRPNLPRRPCRPGRRPDAFGGGARLRPHRAGHGPLCRERDRRPQLLRVHARGQLGVQPRPRSTSASSRSPTAPSTSSASGRRRASSSRRRRSWSTTRVTPPRRSRPTRTPSARSASASPTSARC